jgi:hypothetical protein
VGAGTLAGMGTGTSRGSGTSGGEGAGVTPEGGGAVVLGDALVGAAEGAGAALWANEVVAKPCAITMAVASTRCDLEDRGFTLGWRGYQASRCRQPVA